MIEWTGDDTKRRPPPDGYRPCVGAVVFNAKGDVFAGRRADQDADAEYAWQCPQGGLDGSEDPETGARRELREETGICSIRLLGGLDDWLVYDFPKHVLGRRFKDYKGQAQLWFAYAFEGSEAEIDLAAHGAPEFDSWAWVPLSDLPGLVVPFKRDIYDAIVTAFERYAAPHGAVGGEAG